VGGAGGGGKRKRDVIVARNCARSRAIPILSGLSPILIVIRDGVPGGMSGETNLQPALSSRASSSPRTGGNRFVLDMQMFARGIPRAARNRENGDCRKAEGTFRYIQMHVNCPIRCPVRARSRRAKACAKAR
jgi:hypothetical protein